MANEMFRVRTAFTGIVNGPSVSTHHFATNTLTSAAAQAVVNRVAGFWAALQPGRSPACFAAVQGLVDVIDYVTGLLLTSFAVNGTNAGGSATGTPLPTATQGLFIWETGQILNGKRFRGHTFLPAPTDGNSVTVPNTAYKNLATAAFTAMDPLNATVPLVVWHRPPKPPLAGSGSIGGVVTGMISPKWAVLRSRRD
jgi:hypothetical protein